MVSYIARTLKKGFHQEGGSWSIRTSLLPCNTIALSQTLAYARPLSMVWAVHRCECSSGQTAAVQTAVVSGSSGIWGAQTPCETSILPFLKSEHTQTTGICEKRKQRKPGAVGFSRLPTQGLPHGNYTLLFTLESQMETCREIDRFGGTACLDRD